MESKELRIGNYITLQSGVSEIEHPLFKVKSLFFSEPHNQYVTELNNGFLMNLDLLRYADITEEVLLKFGFEVIVGRINPTFKIDCGAYFFQITLQNDDKSWHLRMSNHDFNEEADIVGLGVIKYIHQLQNLFFALTQTELTLK